MADMAPFVDWLGLNCFSRQQGHRMLRFRLFCKAVITETLRLIVKSPSRIPFLKSQRASDAGPQRAGSTCVGESSQVSCVNLVELAESSRNDGRVNRLTRIGSQWS